MNLADFAVRNRLICAIAALGVAAAGWHAYRNMPRLEDPDFTIRTAVVVTQYPGASAEEVANEVTETLESAIQEMEEVEEIVSTSEIGLSRIDVDIEFAFSRTRADLDLVWSKLRDRVRSARAQLPPGALEPAVNDAFGDVFGLYYLITGEGFSPRELHDYAKTLRTRLLAVPDVGKVAILGERTEAIYIEIARERAAALGVSVDRIYGALAAQNAVAPAGDLRIGDRRLAILPSGGLDSVEAIRNVVFSPAGGGALVRLGDLAEVSQGYAEPPRRLVRYGGRPALALGVAGVTGANIAKIGAAIDAKLAEAASARPLGIELHEFYHQGKVVDAAVDDFVLNVAAALVIVLAVLWLFMGLRPAVAIGAVLLLTVSATLAAMHAAGIPMHRISLGALIIALGMLVDNAIVMVDGILAGVGRGQTKREAAKETADRSKWPLFGGTAVGIVAFAPIGFAPGSTAEYTGDLFWVVAVSLLFSWLFALTAAPLLADLLFPERRAAAGRGAGALGRGYRAFVGRALAARWAVAAAALALFAVSVAGFSHVKQGFFPASTTPQIVVDYWLPEGTDIARTQSDMIALERRVAALEGVEGVLTTIGAGGLRYMLVYAPEPPNASYGQLLVRVDDSERIAGLLPRIQSMIDAHYPDAQGKVWRFRLGPGGGSRIEAVFSGPDPEVLRRLAGEARAIMAADGGAVAIKDDWRAPVPVVQPRYAPARARLHGVSREDIAQALQTASSGRRIGAFREGDTLIPIVARAPAGERRRGGAGGLESVQVPNPVTGGVTPLVEAVDGFETVWRNNRLRRVDRVWTVKAQCDPAPGRLVSEVQARLRPGIEAIALPEGYRLAWEGEHGDSSEANANLLGALPLGFLAMVLIVVLLFNALRQPLVIWLAVPLSLTGAVFGLLATGTVMEFMALLGLLSLSGLVIKNAIVLVERMDFEIAAGKPRRDAIVESAASRARPVLLGALTTVLGVAPLLGDAFFRSMAVVLMFGLGFATLLTLVVVPALYAIFFGAGGQERVAARPAETEG